MVRSALVLLGLLLSVAAAGELVRPGFDGLGWAGDVGWLGPRLGPLLQGLVAWTLLRLAFCRAPSSEDGRRARRALLLLMAAQAVSLLISAGAAQGTTSVAGRLVQLGALAALALRLYRHPPAWAGRRPALATAMGTLLLGTALALLHIVAFVPASSLAAPRQAREEAAAVVFGARAYADGRASPPLAERMAAACRLHSAGHVRRLILSGGPADGRMHETLAMRRLARACGVAEADLLLDRDGLSTHRTVVASLALARRHGVTRLVAVSQGWHLARITLDYQRRGVRVGSVAAADHRSGAAVARQHLREVIAFWGYFVLRV